MWTLRWLSVSLLALLLAGGGDILLAQQGLAGGGLGLNGVGPRLGENVALALELQNELGLSGDQVQTLQNLKGGIANEVEPVEAEINALRAMIQGGSTPARDGLLRLQALYEEYQIVAEPYRTQIDAVLTPQQHEALQGIMWESRPYGGLGLGRAGTTTPMGSALGAGQPLGLRGGVGLGRGARVGIGQGAGLRAGRGIGRGYGRGMGVGRARGGGRGLRWW